MSDPIAFVKNPSSLHLHHSHLSPQIEALEGRVLLSGSPYPGGVAAVIPGTIEAENYDSGGEGVAYHDLSQANQGGTYRPAEGVDIQCATTPSDRYFVGFAKAGEWMQYTVQAATAGLYRLETNIASLRGGGRFHVEFDSSSLKSAVRTVPQTGDWQKFVIVSLGDFQLTAGTHTLRLVCDGNDGTGYVANFEWIRFSTAVDPRGPFNGAPTAVPGTIQAEDFDLGGEGVAYHDLTAANQGGAYRNTEAVDIEPAGDAGGGYDVGFVKAGEWIEYTISAASSGRYNLIARLASPAEGGAFHIEIDRRNVTGTLRIPITQNWQNYHDIIVRDIAISAGTHIMRLVAESNNRWGYTANFNYFTITSAQATPLRVSSDGHYLVRADGSTFYWIADTGWRMFNRLTPADASFYLSDRAAKGFTVVRAAIIDSKARTNVYGQSPLLNDDPAKPNEAYFQTMDQMVRAADAAGLWLAIVPAWGDMVAGTHPIFTTSESARTFGRFLGNRYRGDNIVWIVNCDFSADGVQDIWRAMADGLGESGGEQLITCQPDDRNSSSSWFHNDDRFDFNTIESDHTRDSSTTYSLVGADYQLQPPKPTIDGEPNYEDVPNGLVDGQFQLNDYDVRKKAWWAYLSGAFGITYGQMDVYQFWQSPLAPDFPKSRNLAWKDALNRAGALQMKYIQKMMQSRPLSLRIPDLSLVVSSTLSNGDHVQAARASDGSYGIVYIASGKPVTVDLTKLSGSTIRASWYNPRNGSYTAIGNFAKSSRPSFTPPGSGTDWVLVLDDNSRGYAVS